MARRLASLTAASPPSRPSAPVATTTATTTTTVAVVPGFHVDDGCAGDDDASGARDARAVEAAHVRAAVAAIARRGAVRAPCLFDLETTGLGGDAVPFVVGLAWARDDGPLVLQQFRLDAAASERAMWLAVVEALAAADAIVTYNGASFDRTIVRVRLRRLGLWRGAVAHRFEHDHLDLLPLCRRLWRGRASDARLATLERVVLGAHRLDDIAGEAIATFGRAWIDGDRSRVASEAVAKICRHNAWDLRGLGALAVACRGQLEAPEHPAAVLAAVRHHREAGAEACAHAMAEAGVRRWPLVPARRAGADAIALALELAALRRRAGDRDGAHALLSAICEVAPGHTEAATALAKDCEHRLRRPDLALQWALAAAWPCARRVARLRRKLAVGSGAAIECPAIECPAIATAVVPPVAATDLREMPQGPTLPGARTTAPVVPAAAVTRAEAGAAAIPGSWRRRSATVVG